MSKPLISWFGPDSEFHHLGVVVESIIGAVGGDIQIWRDDIQDVCVGFVVIGGLCIEFIQPLGGKSPVAGNLKRRQPLAHVCFEVPCLEDAVASGHVHGFRRLTRPVVAVAFGGRRIVWVYSNRFGLVELLEKAHLAG